jgi:DNA-binding NarL/FixJ family response regulator
MEELGAVIGNLLARSQIIQSERQFNPQQSTVPSPENRSEEFHFTQREKDVLELLTQGLSNMEMGGKLHLSSRTVEKYVSSLLRKTDTNNRAELVSFALKHHLIP